MACPFLRDAEVRFCEAAPFRTMIPNGPGASGEEMCSSPEHVRCGWAQGRVAAPRVAGACPSLRVSLVQYCEAAPEPRFLPYSEDLLTACGSEGFRSCHLFRSRANPDEAGARAGDPPAASGAADALDPPRRFAFAANHMWLDVARDDSWRVGLDGFFGDAVGAVDRVLYMSPSGQGRPTVGLSIHGVGHLMEFPISLPIAVANETLRDDPSPIVRDPYGSGWMLEGRLDPDAAARLRLGPIPGLRRDDEAAAWARRETERLTRWVHALAGRPGRAGEVTMHDGGRFVPGLAAALPREDLLRLLHGFFTAERDPGLR